MLMLVWPIVPTTQVIIAWTSDEREQPSAREHLRRVADIDVARPRARAGPGPRLPADRRATGDPPLLRAQSSGTVVNVTSHVADLPGSA
jgi:hypothetical protein